LQETIVRIFLGLLKHTSLCEIYATSYYAACFMRSFNKVHIRHKYWICISCLSVHQNFQLRYFSRSCPTTL